MKKLAYLFLFSLLALSLAGCGDDDDNGGDNTPFEWRGDWNDPADPHYQPEGYNPIRGTWQKVGGGVINWFTDDYVYKVRNEDGTYGNVSKGKYKINDTAFRYINIQNGVERTCEYSITQENGVTYLNWRRSINGGYTFDEWTKWKKLD